MVDKLSLIHPRKLDTALRAFGRRNFEKISGLPRLRCRRFLAERVTADGAVHFAGNYLWDNITPFVNVLEFARPIHPDASGAEQRRTFLTPNGTAETFFADGTAVNILNLFAKLKWLAIIL